MFHLFLTIAAGLIVLSIGVMLLVMFTAKPDPHEVEEKNKGKVISYVDQFGHFHYEGERKQKIK